MVVTLLVTRRVPEGADRPAHGTSGPEDERFRRAFWPEDGQGNRPNFGQIFGAEGWPSGRWRWS